MNIRSGASQEGTTVGACAYPVGLFLACFAFSYLDRQIMSILVEPLKATLHISDIQIGILQGFSFTLCYATAGVIISRMVDSANRVRLITVCVAIWACSTMLCATAGSYTELLIWRGGTAIAEAALSPAVLSLFADMFIASRLTRATGIFMLGPYIGSGLALTGGGMLLGWLTREMGHMPGLAAMHPWQWVFLIVGLPGILLSILVFFTVSEPARRNHQASQTSVEKGTPAFRDVLNELLVKNRFCLPFYFAYTCLIMLFYSLTAWFPTVMMRHFTLTAGYVGQITGPVYMCAGVVGVLLAGKLVRAALPANLLRDSLKVSACACGLLIIFSVLASCMPFSAAIIFYAITLFCASITMALAPIPLQIAIPNRMRGRAISLLVFMTNLLGGGIGPFLVGYLSQKFHGIDNALGLGLAIVSVSAATAATLFYTLAMKRSATAVSHD